MASQMEDFKHSGPLHLSFVDWSCLEHRRSVAACLVQGAYILERDRQQSREGSDALAAGWWESFHFKLIDKLVDKVDSSIFGAIYEIAHPEDASGSTVTFLNTSGNAPRFVLAFRGTIPKKKSISRDAKLDLCIMKNGLHRTSRFENAMKSASSLVADAGCENVWIAGHSLGAAIATLTGKNLAKEGINVATFLFNPPFFAAPIERIKSEKFKERVRIANGYITAGIAMAMKGQHRASESFTKVSSWVPHVFVNPADHICSAYIGYFELRQKMEKIGAVKVGRLATQSSVRDLLLSAFGGDSNPQHLLPSANLTVNCSPAYKSFMRAHGIHQWWNPHQDMRSREYLYCLAYEAKEDNSTATDTADDEGQ